MRCFWILPIVICILALAGPVSAAPGDADHLSIAGSWAVAGDTAGAQLQIVVFDESDTPVQGALVTLECLDPLLGLVSSQTFTTDVNGLAKSAGNLPVFTPSTRSGSAAIRIVAVKNTTVSEVYQQGIDHATPYRYALVTYPATGSVEATMPITVRMEDRYRNPVDGRRTAEQIHFVTGSPGDGAVFPATGTTSIVQNVDAAGNCTVLLRLSPFAGENVVMISPVPTTVQTIWIEVAGTGGEPYSILPRVEPADTPYPRIPADGSSQFLVTYTLLDPHGNPSAGGMVNVTTSLGERVTLGPSNSFGQVKMLYGKKTSIGFVTLTASAAENPAARCSHTVEFVGSGATQMDLVASPISMASLDANPATVSLVRARVMDASGNPVRGESVVFSILDRDVQAGLEIGSPTFSNGMDTISATTDGDGYAVVTFVPGRFSTDKDEPGFNYFSTGTCTMLASWGSIGKSLALTYKNYPYLRIETTVSDTTIEANSTLDVTVRLIGDGHRITWRDPVDIALAPSRSGTMMYQTPDIMTYAFAAEHAFLEVLEEHPATGGFDAIGILSYGNNPNGSADILALPKQDQKYAGLDNTQADDTAYVLDNYPGNGRPYDGYASLEQPLIPDIPAIRAAVNRTVPYGGVTSGIVNPLRLALFEGVNAVAPGANEIKGVIVLVDNSWSYYGDPLARGNPTNDFTINEGNRYYPFDGLGSGTFSEQNMSVYAKNRDVKFYVVYVADKENTNDRECLMNLGASTGGSYNYTSDPSRIKDIYAWIADQLIHGAACGADMNINMVAFDDTTNVTYTAGDIFTYEHTQNPPESVNSTEIRFFEWTGADPYTSVRDMNWSVVNKTDEWNSNHAFHFDVGTIHVGETWQTTFRLRANDTINDTIQFRLFAPGSAITFDNDPGATLSFYNTSPIITVFPHMITNVLVPSTLDISNFAIVNRDSMTEFCDVGWDVTYTGNSTVHETLSYQYFNPAFGSWDRPVDLETISFTDQFIGQHITASMDIRGLPTGQYRIIVRAEAEDGPSDQEMDTMTLGARPYYIKIE